MGNPKVSVCIPVYNRQDYVSEAIESVLAQSFTDFELIICDNSSTDKTVEVIEKYAAEDSRIRFYQNEKNLGVIGNMNQCLLRCNGEYIKFIFSDDRLTDNCIEVFTKVMDENPTVALATSYTKNFGNSDKFRGEEFFPANGFVEGKKAQKSLLLEGNWPGSPSSTIFRRKELHVGMIHQFWRYWLGDLDFSIRLLGVGDGYIVPEVLSNLRVHDDSESAMHGVDFRLIKEKLMLTAMAFEFPHVYGEFTKKEKRQLSFYLLKRLVREGLSKKGFNTKKQMLIIGFSKTSPSRLKFVYVLLKNIGRVFRSNKKP